MLQQLIRGAVFISDSREGMTMRATVWLKGLRLPLYWASGAPIVLSLSLGVRYGTVQHLGLWLIAAAALLIFEVGVNLFAEVSDRNEGVFVTQAESLIPTGPYLIETTGASVERIERYAALTFAVAGILGLYIAAVTGFVVIMLIGAAGFLLTVLYAAPPFMLGLRGIGEPVPFIAFGPLPGIALYFILSGQVSAMAAVVTVPAAFWITAVRFAHHLPDRSMKRGARFEQAHRFRVGHSVQLLALFSGLGCITIAGSVQLAGPALLFPAAVSLVLSAVALRSSMKSGGNVVEISRGTKYYVLLQLAGSIAMAVAIAAA